MGGAGVIPLGPPMPPEANEINAPKDTINVPHSTITRALVKFDLPLNTLSSPGKAFRYVHHCHNLEHEDNEMMRPYDVIG
jgi:spore coat protein A, manganese oxidase